MSPARVYEPYISIINQAAETGSKTKGRPLGAALRRHARCKDRRPARVSVCVLALRTAPSDSRETPSKHFDHSGSLEPFAETEPMYDKKSAWVSHELREATIGYLQTYTRNTISIY